ncbi:MAG: PQQ-binding-like beta-propeller repeat protein [Bacteroidales bacterium]|nr:PQQ-binding-like beta-propeller repeat protein [Bacteroidales bacterium]MCF8390035.1 PQQ-binding-like beta-propeller repeat protein [Bacteroidales bacterium]
MISKQNIILSLLIVAGFISLGWWLIADPVKELTTSEPGADNRGKGVEVNLNINIGEFYEHITNESSDLKETWPRFRGEDFDNISKSKVALIDKFGPNGPDIKWRIHLGEGHAGAAIYEGKVYVLDYDEELRSDMLRCYSLESGTELWKRWYKVNIKRNHGMSRTVPAVTKDYILTIGPRSHVMCVNREDGELRWGLNVEAEYHTDIPFWYTGQCPLIDEGKAIIATGGSALMVAIDLESGEKIWETPNEGNWAMSHSSIMPFNYKGVKMYVYSGIGGVFGIAAEGENAGKILWKSTEWNHQVVAPSPLCMPDGKIFLSAGYGAGSMVVQLKMEADVFSVETLQKYAPKEGLASEQQTPVVYDGHVFGILPKDAGQYRNQFVCVNPADFTQIIWSSGPTVRFGLGPYMIADGKFFILSDDGTLTIAKPSVKQYIQLDQAKILDGQDAWGPLAIADGYLIMRDSETMLCIDIAKKRH